MSLWILILHFSISKTQWKMLEFFKHPVHAVGMLQVHSKPSMLFMYMCLKYFNMDINSEFLNLTNAMSDVYILSTLSARCRPSVHLIYICLKYVNMDVHVQYASFKFG